MWCSPLHRITASQLVGWRLKRRPCRASAGRRSHPSASSCKLEEVAQVRGPSNALGQVESSDAHDAMRREARFTYQAGRSRW
eukprot:6227782-Prymnesium_polylepis.2